MKYRSLVQVDESKVVAAVSLRGMGNMSLSRGGTSSSLENRKRFLGALGIDHSQLVCAGQAHSDNIICVGRSHSGMGALRADDAIEACDAFVTNQKRLPMAVFTADCLSVFLYDPAAEAAGLAHAGWRGTLENIAGKTARLMRAKYGSKPSDLRAGFGPAIGVCCYRVGEDLRGKFGKGLSEKDGRLYLDLARANKEQLLEEGLDPAKICAAPDCTFCGEDYFSYRREKALGARMMSVIMLK